MDERERATRQAIIDACLALNASGLNQGASGNISARFGGRMLITPSATPYAELAPEMIAATPIDGDEPIWEGPLKASTEWRFHRDILRARDDVGAVVHAHPTYCTALSINREDLPAAHYMIAAFGGATVRCSAYALFGTQALSATALAALEGRTACLLANHGMIAIGETLAKAMWRAEELETLARQYVIARQCGKPVILSDEEVAAALDAFGAYGRRERR